MEKYKILIQPFHSDFTDDYTLEFSCPNCGEAVISNVRTQKNLAVGGLGHKCDSCNIYYAIAPCPKCNKTLFFDHEEWQRMANSDESFCPNCSAILYREQKILPDLCVGYNFSSSLINWTSTNYESDYLDKVRKLLSEETQDKTTSCHHSVAVRMMSASDALEDILKNKWYSPLVLTNQPLTTSNEKFKTPDDHEFHKHLFSFINNTRSAIDILAQEIAVIVLNKYKDKDIDIFAICKELNKQNDFLKTIITDFTNSDSFSYLNKLRNVMQHRRIPAVYTFGKYSTSELDAIHPVDVKSLANIKLPDDPYKKASEYTFNKNIELFSFLQNSFSESKDFAIRVYRHLDSMIS